MAKSDRLLTPQQQRFFFAIVEGKSQVEAYKAAGFRGGKSADALSRNANMIAKSPAIVSALARARAELAAKAELTVTDLVEQLLQTREIALSIDPPQANAAVSATMGIGKLLGLVLDRSELTVIRDKPSPIPVKALELSEEDWKRTFSK